MQLFILAIQRFAQANSVASTARPAGITMKAGPGRTIKAIPSKMTVPPMTATVMRLICRNVFN